MGLRWLPLTEPDVLFSTRYLILVVSFSFARPMVFALIPIAICCAYQSLAFINKFFSHTPVWQKFGQLAYAKADEAMPHALMLCATVEIGLGVYSIIELFTPQRSFGRLFMMWNFLKMRAACFDNTIFRCFSIRLLLLLNKLVPVCT